MPPVSPGDLTPYKVTIDDDHPVSSQLTSGGKDVKEVRTVTFFIGNRDGRGLYRRSKIHIVNPDDPTRAKCGIDFTWHNGITGPTQPRPFLEINPDRLCCRCEQSHRKGR
jgi:hypothetical protein